MLQGNKQSLFGGIPSVSKGNFLNDHLKELGAPHVEEEVRKIGEAGWPLKAGRVVFGVVSKLGCYPDQHSVQPSQYIKDVLLTAPAVPQIE